MLSSISFDEGDRIHSQDITAIAGLNILSTDKEIAPQNKRDRKSRPARSSRTPQHQGQSPA